MKKADFFKDVRHEIDMLKKHATKDEIARFDFKDFDPENIGNCIYGQMTGSCCSERSKELMNVACVRVRTVWMNVRNDGTAIWWSTEEEAKQYASPYATSIAIPVQIPVE